MPGSDNCKTERQAEEELAIIKQPLIRRKQMEEKEAVEEYPYNKQNDPIQTVFKYHK